MSKDAKGMKGKRARTNDGTLRQKRSDTHIETIEKKYNRDFKVRGDMHLGTFLKKNNLESLNDLIESDLGKKD